MDAKEQIRAGLMAFINEKPEEAKEAFNKALELKMRAAMANSSTETPSVETPPVATESVEVDDTVTETE